MSNLKYLVSACLAGVKCRFDGEDRKDEKIYQLVKRGEALPFCPEQLCGLPTPRKPSQILYHWGKRKVLSFGGEDLSNIFQKGAELSFNLAKRFKINSAYLKRRSPSCGYGLEQRKGKARGVTSAHFLKKGMRVFSR